MSGVSRFSLRLARPLATASGRLDRREGLLVRVGEDPAGLGEATPLAGWTEPIDACRAAIAEALDRAPRRPADARGRPDIDLSGMASTPAARHGLELALLDRAARRSTRPLYRQLGGPRRVDAVPVNATVGDGDVESTVRACVDAVDRGVRAVKVKVGARGVETDLARLGAVRDAVGDGVELRVDANGAWTPDQAETAVERLARLEVTLVEQPLAPDALADHAALRGRGLAVALDESLRDAGLRAVLKADAADLLVLKPMVHGGVGRARDLALEARDHGLGVVVTTTVDAAVARTAAVHLAASLGVDRACGLATADWLAEDVAADPAPVTDGAIEVPQGDGHGVRADVTG